MNASIEEVNEYLTEANDKASKDNEEKFSKFLYKLDRTNGITKRAEKAVYRNIPDDEYIHQRCRSGSRCAD